MTERIGVFVEDGIVTNRVVWSDHLVEEYAGHLEHIEEVTDYKIQPGIGWWWDTTNGFRPPRPYLSWLWNTDRWEAPIPMPEQGGPYRWNEEQQTWEPIESAPEA